MTYNIDLVLKELFGLQRLGIKVGLEHTEELLDNIGNPHSYLKFIHIAGTNGKGSTCAILNKILIEHGMIVGLYTSPHLVRFNERIQVNNEKISDADIVLFMNKYIQQIKNIISKETKHIALVDSAYAVAKNAYKILEETSLLNMHDKSGVLQCYVTDLPMRFEELGNIFLGSEINNLHLVNDL